MTHDKLRKSLHRRAQDFTEWLEGTLEVREHRTATEIEAVSHSIIRAWGQPEPDEGIDDSEQYLHLWEALEYDSMCLVDDPSEMNSTIGFSCTPPLEVAEYLLVVGLILARSAVKHFQSNSHKRHLIAAHLLSDATEARNYWMFTRGIARCRNPDVRFVNVENKIQQWAFREMFRETRVKIGKNAADKRHEQEGGSRDKRAQVLAAWATGEYTTHTDCVTKVQNKIGISYDTAIKALRNAPKPKRAAAK